MKNRIFNNALPIGGGSIGGLTPLFANMNTITWHGVGDLAIQAAILALVGGLIGWLVKRVLDCVFKKK